ncbi:hypothetical protein HC026_02040 [Lactobacillus sp. LC28-10]|uniref:Uncharacterized protein n=1 Tax=Secundilactobacillus angelensis TaxID=2722706 RepID=A0ABX1KWS6_9LACO|nr:hypothetical protein [Secundilactobacillus angelensis]MCH5461492.1 hypothetical protein [Secundilactobacillus angelensis]NLR17695.1 hypothetical protein [Secundilactobacillus angelensis]
MPEYRGSIKITSPNIGSKRIVAKYRGTTKFYSAYVPIGTLLYDFSGYALGFGAEHVGGATNPQDPKIRVLSSNTIVLTASADKIAHGIAFKTDKNAAQYYPQPSALGVRSPFKPAYTFQVTKAQLAVGFVYATIGSTKLSVTLKGNQLSFTSTPIPSGYPNVGTGYDFAGSENFKFVLFDSITAY